MAYAFPGGGGGGGMEGVWSVSFFTPAVSQVTLTQNNQQATVAYFGTT